MTRTDLWCPFADRESVGNHGGLMGCYSWRQSSLGVLEHVTAGYGDPYGWFNNSSSQASATWYIAKTGRLKQYMSATARCWAQMAGNDLYQAVETEGQPGEPLTPEQVEAFAQLYAWAQDQPELAWPLREANAANEEGLGWHGMDPGYGHPFCPGELRKAQRPTILARAVQIIGNPTGELVMDDAAKAAFAAQEARMAAQQGQIAALTTALQGVAAAVAVIRAELHSTLPYTQRIDAATQNLRSGYGTLLGSVQTAAASSGEAVSLVKAIPAPGEVKVTLDQGTLVAALSDPGVVAAMAAATLSTVNLRQVPVA